jgi:hypothetical protein
LAYLSIALSYFFIIPIFEAPDEWTHTGHVKYIADGHGLPVMLPGQGIWGGQQPPLYYTIGAILVQPFDLSDLETYLEQAKNPHASLGYALDPGNKNNYLHAPDESFPYRGLSLAVHVLRLYSLALGLIALIFAYLVAYELFSASGLKQSTDVREPQPRWHKPGLFASVVALFVACQPMFAFITASVANEPANMAFSAIGLWLAQKYVLFGPTPKLGRALALGVVLGLISLSKMTGLAFGLVLAVALLQATITWRKQSGLGRLLWRDSLVIALSFLVVAGWWYWRNYRLYGDFFQQGLYQVYFNQVPQPLALKDFLFHLAHAEVSFWATFGWLNLTAPEWVYRVYRLISRIGLLGVALAVLIQLGRTGWQQYVNRRNPRRQAPLSGRHFPATTYHTAHLIIHFVFPIAVAFSLTRLVALEGGLQGRQLLPALGSIAIVIIWGWWTIVPARLRWPVLGLLAAFLFGLALWLPHTIVAREYKPRPLLSEADLPAGLQRLDLTYDGALKLLAVEIAPEVVRPGERLRVTVYWQSLKPMTTNYSVFVHLLGRGYDNVGQFNTYPGLGLRPTTTLEPGQIVVDTYPVMIDGGSQAPTRLVVNVGLFKFDEPGRPGIQPVASDGQAAAPTVGQLKLIPANWPAHHNSAALAEFADNILLTGYQVDRCRLPNDDCKVTLVWFARDRPSTDYTVFLQLWHNGRQAAGFDSPPLANDYPTSLWSAQEVILDPHSLDLSTIPPGEYQLVVGLYDYFSGERLPVTASDGAPLADYAMDLGTITIEPVE